VAAAQRVREAGYTKFDAHSPYPIHGLDGAMGIRATRLAWIVFAAGVLGALVGLTMQWWMNATHAADWSFLPSWLQGYSYRISGKPYFSLPANIPVIFELTVLLAALAAVFGMLTLNNLPWFHNVLNASPRFRRATTDRFFISILATDPQFDAQRTLALAGSLGGTVEPVHEVPSPPLPRWVVWIAWILVSLALLPPVLVWRARYTNSPEPRIHPIQDMDNQERYKSQQANPAFADERAMRPKVVGTVAREDWPVDAHYELGYHMEPNPKTGVMERVPFEGLPEGVDVTLENLQRGQQRFNVYCTPCHGYDGQGHGIVHARALKLQTRGWVPPSNLTGDVLSDPKQTPDGHLYYVIANGSRTMPGYGDQIPVADRWKIVEYIRALQRSTHAKLDDVPPELRPGMK
jgi:mono/diheme cytochrome c family protein